MNEVLKNEYFHNTVGEYLIAFGIILLGIILVRIFKRRFLVRIKRWANRTVNTLDDFAVQTLDRLGIPALYLIIVYSGISYLTFPAKVHKVIDNSATVVITILIIRLVSSIILMLLKSYLERQERGQDKVRQLAGLMIIINTLIWIMGILFLFDNMGYNVTALITGLGIGGIAVALAAQNILGDLFNYFVIFLDRPFEVNDFVTVDDKSGTIEYIGIKTTRVLSLTGEQLVFANSDLTGSRIHNYKRMETRRAVFTLSVVYDISTEKLKKIPGMLKSIVEEHRMVKFDRAHWTTFGNFSLNFEVVYLVLSSDYNTYMDIQQSINIRIFETFEAEGIAFARPTTTVYLNQPGQETQAAGR
ncbi:mechanosensitive ion channel protein MscS [Pedobacter yulinensis]|uniref:Mechanosensitive ion channel protein MscS n=1 Tax=Pedobacter yulinensis TaxID=2126353 RepID=A0A2T3HJZ5_9SPHI|nr:mechanosensitive ion channel family protein [Pedobacter yulinensis]PST82739.1 mechanosensitive ion channel protein MscS [Pedobacter yulinensis]